MADASIRFFGAAENVTGSAYVIEAGGRRFMVDCGFYQERQFKQRNWDPFPVAPESIDAVLLTHAHLDHCGRLPKLVAEGFKGPIYSTDATAEIAKIVLLDSAHIQEEDVRHKRERHEREGRKSPYPYKPLYTTEDAENSISAFEGVRYNAPVDLGGGCTAEFYDAGHILGSASILLTVPVGKETRRVLFSGDIGRWNTPIMNDPTLPDEADYVLVESTYGNRQHGDNSRIPERLSEVIHRTHREGGNIVIPSFAVERTQELLYRLHELLAERRIPHLQVFVDSPMAIRVTEVFRKHPELFDEETMEILNRGEHPCDFPGLTMSRSTDQSKMINNIRGTSIIIAGSGMCTGGRVKHHLKNNISRPESTILFVGYQARGTLGRIILSGKTPVRIHGENYAVKAAVEKISGFSAHADRDELMQWLGKLQRPPKHVFVTHGEEDAAHDFSKDVHREKGWSTSVATYEAVAALE